MQQRITDIFFIISSEISKYVLNIMNSRNLSRQNSWTSAKVNIFKVFIIRLFTLKKKMFKCPVNWTIKIIYGIFLQLCDTGPLFEKVTFDIY